MEESKEYSVPAIERAVHILDALCQQNLTISAVNKELKIPKTSAFMILNTLEKHSLIEKKEDGTFKLGYRTFQWGMNFYNNISLTNMSRPLIEKLVSNTPYTGHLAILPEDNLPIYMDKVEGNGFVRFATTIGQQLPLHLSGVGKALGLNLSDKVVLNTIKKYGKDINNENEQQILTKFKNDIEFIKQNGYAVEDEEMEEGIRCLAAPIFGPYKKVVASISITALSKDLLHYKTT